MGDPLSISASIIGLLEAVRTLYGFIDTIKSAPETLAKAGDDLKSTESVIEDLRQYLDAPAHTPQAVKTLTDQKSALSSILSRFKKLCDDFHKKLDSCVSHSGEGSKLAWTDRLKTSLSKRSIEKFQVEVSRARLLISLRVSTITLVNSEHTVAAIHNFQLENDAAMAGITQQLADLDATLIKLQDISDESSEAMEKAFRDQEATLKDQLRLCEENRATTDSQVSHRQEFGNANVKNDGRNLQGLDGMAIKGAFHQKFGNLDLSDSGRSAQGALTKDMLDSSFFHGAAVIAAAATNRQPERFQGRGRVVGSSNVHTVHGGRGE